MATKRKGGGGGGESHARGGPALRPKLKSSHAGAAAPKKPRAAKRAAPGSGGSRPPHGDHADAVAKRKAARGPGLRARKPRPGGASSGPGAGGVASDAAREVAVAIAIAALDKKAVGLEILDVAGKVDYADFLVIMTGRSDRQVAALAQGIEEALRKKNVRALAIEGLSVASWVLMDFGDVVVHVFQDDARSLYDIEGLWMDARRVPVPVPEG